MKFIALFFALSLAPLFAQTVTNGGACTTAGSTYVQPGSQGLYVCNGTQWNYTPISVLTYVQRNVPNGVAGLDEAGKLPLAIIPPGIGGGGGGTSFVKVSDLPAPTNGNKNVPYLVYDAASASTCSTGGGNYVVTCMNLSGSNYTALQMGNNGGGSVAPILSGTVAPTGTTGVNGDFYIQNPSTSPVLYGPKASGAWPTGISMVGPQGVAGAQGIAGQSFTWRGPWSSATAYALRDVVSLNGNSYIAILAGTNQNPATATTYWQVMAQKGTDGAGATIPTTTALLKGNNAGAAIAAGVTDVTAVFPSGTGALCKDGTVGNCGISGGGGSGVQVSNLANMPATGTPGATYYVPDQTSGLQLYTAGSDNNFVQLLTAGPSGAFQINNGVADITSAVPLKSNSESIPGLWQFNQGIRLANAACTGTGTTGCVYWNNTDSKVHQVTPGGTDTAFSTSAQGQYYQTMRFNGTDQVQRAKLELVQGNNVTITPIDDSTNNVSKYRIDVTAVGGASFPSINDDGNGHIGINITAGGNPLTLKGGSNLPGNIQMVSGDNNGQFIVSAYGDEYDYFVKRKMGFFDANFGKGTILLFRGGMQLTGDDAVSVTCESKNNGFFQFVPGGSGVADTLKVCAKDASNNYIWRTIF